MTETISLGISPCPNDTYIFGALLQGRIDTSPYSIRHTLADVQTLNEMALRGEPDVVKISVAAYGRVSGQYELLRSGGALGRGCGPVLVSGRPLAPSDLKGLRIAIPGRLTTAFLLMQRLGAEPGEVLEMSYERVMSAVTAGDADAGLVIHEGRFTYPAHGLHKVLDLGCWWEETTGLPVPLGVIAARRSLGEGFRTWMEERIRGSLEDAERAPDELWPFIRDCAQEMDQATVREHIDTFVTGFTRDMGPEGEEAIQRLVQG